MGASAPEVLYHFFDEMSPRFPVKAKAGPVPGGTRGLWHGFRFGWWSDLLRALELELQCLHLLVLKVPLGPTRGMDHGLPKGDNLRPESFAYCEMLLSVLQACVTVHFLSSRQTQSLLQNKTTPSVRLRMKSRDLRPGREQKAVAVSTADGALHDWGARSFPAFGKGRNLDPYGFSAENIIRPYLVRCGHSLFIEEKVRGLPALSNNGKGPGSQPCAPGRFGHPPFLGLRTTKLPLCTS